MIGLMAVAGQCTRAEILLLDGGFLLYTLTLLDIFCN
jgi:hypothetical protein